MLKIVPLTTDPNQNFICTLPIDSKNITLAFKISYNSIGGYWFMSITDKVSGTNYLDAVPLVTGEYPSANLLGQYSYLNIGSCVIVKTGSLSEDIPNNVTLGSNFVLVWSDTIE